MKILVTGAAGFIGSHTVDYLLAEGHEVVGLDNLESGSMKNLDSALNRDNFKFVELDLTDGYNKVSNLIKKQRPEALIHLAALVSVTRSIAEPNKNYVSNILATHHLLEASRINKVETIVFASSAAIYGDVNIIPTPEHICPSPLSPYGAAKTFAESMLQAYGASFGIKTVCFRYFNVFGPRQNPDSPYSGVISIFVNQLKNGHPVTVYGDGSQTRDFIYVKDVARYNCLAATWKTAPAGIYNLCTGSESSINQLITEISLRLNKEGKVNYIDPRKGDIYRSCGDNTKLVEMFSCLPDYDLKAGLMDWLI